MSKDEAESDLFINKSQISSFELDEYNQPASVIELDHIDLNDASGLLDFDDDLEEDDELISHRKHSKNTRKISHRNLRLCYGFLILLIAFVIGGLLIVTYKVLGVEEKERNRPTPGKAYQNEFTEVYSPSRCLIESDISCPLATNNYTIPSYTQGFIISTFRSYNSDSWCKKPIPVIFEESNLNAEVKRDLLSFWPFGIKRWRSEYEHYGNCMPQFSDNGDAEYDQQTYFRNALKIHKGFSESAMKKLPSALSVTDLKQNASEPIIKHIKIQDLISSVLKMNDIITPFIACNKRQKTGEVLFHSVTFCTNDLSEIEPCSSQRKVELSDNQAQTCGEPSATIGIPLIISK